MLKDIEIAQRAEQLHIREIAEKIGLSEDDIELYGKNKAKISRLNYLGFNIASFLYIRIYNDFAPILIFGFYLYSYVKLNAT